MPRSASPPSSSRLRSLSPRRARDREERNRPRESRDGPSDRDRPRDRDRGGDRDRDRDRASDRDRDRDRDRENGDRSRTRHDDGPRRDRDRDYERDSERRRERDRADRYRDRDDRPRHRDEGRYPEREREHGRERDRSDRAPPSGPSSGPSDPSAPSTSHSGPPPRPRSRSRSRSPPRAAPRRPKELSFYKKSSSSSRPYGVGGGEMEEIEESEKERLQRRERGEVPARFGGTKEQGVRNTMARMAPQGSAPSGMGSFRRGADPLDRMGSKGGEAYGAPPAAAAPPAGGRQDGDRIRQERMAAMDKPRAVAGSGAAAAGGARPPRFIEVIANSRMGGKVRVKCLPTDTVGDLKKLIAAQTGTTAQKIQLKKWYTNFKDHVTLQDYEINDGMSLEMY